MAAAPAAAVDGRTPALRQHPGVAGVGVLLPPELRHGGVDARGDGSLEGAPADGWTYSMSWQQLAERSHWA